MMVLSDKSFDIFRKLTDEEKEELKPHFIEIAKELKQIVEWYNKAGVAQ